MPPSPSAGSEADLVVSPILKRNASTECLKTLERTRLMVATIWSLIKRSAEINRLDRLTLVRSVVAALQEIHTGIDEIKIDLVGALQVEALGQETAETAIATVTIVGEMIVMIVDDECNTLNQNKKKMDMPDIPMDYISNQYSNISLRLTKPSISNINSRNLDR